MKVAKSERQRRRPKQALSGRFNIFIVASRLCENMNDSFEMEICLATLNTIIPNEEAE